MPSILPPPTDKQVATRFVCPICATDDVSPAVRVEHLGIMRADCICPSGHLFVVRWNEVLT